MEGDAPLKLDGVCPLRFMIVVVSRHPPPPLSLLIIEACHINRFIFAEQYLEAFTKPGNARDEKWAVDKGLHLQGTTRSVSGQ